jgi:hypothetical protein
MCDRNAGGLWWDFDGDLDGWLSGPSSGTWLSEPVQETGMTGLGMWLSGPVRTWSLEPGLSVWEDEHTLRAGSVGNFRPTIKQQGMTPVTACTTSNSSRQLVQGGLSPGLTPASAYPRDPPTDDMTLLWEDDHTLRAGSVGTLIPTVSQLELRVQSGGLASVLELRERLLASDSAADVMLQERCHVFCH